ncbi:vacuolar protein sorting 55 superfamily protein [Suillus plorans]|uniref:Vacuolar protein sorting 55 superfamily protein n=1 Tax=Suillus plorans TaxID=116603 RepID=A0A9P7AJ13_9AGAM|nr:vacuolar protein sorting 55 superfamily protein [Suillus plorans]KAG1789882.1 vacuolar protein sorting 55 superfamily protein [Suillus plorans]
MSAGLKTVILLSFVLAVGFLLIILSCALWVNWLPLLVALTFVLAPLPNALFAHCGGDEFSSSDNATGAVDLGRFLTSIIVVTGFALPVVLTHSEVLKPGACAMSIIGGGYVLFDFTILRAHCFLCRLVYGTILAYSAAFRQDDEYD